MDGSGEGLASKRPVGPLPATRALRGLGAAASRAERAYREAGEARAFDHWAEILVRGGWLERLERLVQCPSGVDPRRASAWRVRSAYARPDYCEALRRSEAHLTRFDPGAEDATALAEMVGFCRAAGLSKRDLKEITGGQALAALAPDLPKSRARWTAPRPDWIDEIRRQWAVGSTRRPLARLFLSQYDWLNRDANVPRVCWKVAKVMGQGLSEHIRMAPYLNGDRTLEAFEVYIETLYELGRTADIEFLLSAGASSARLAFYRVLARCDLGLAGEDSPPSPKARGEREVAYRQLLDLRRAAQREQPPQRILPRKGGRRRFALCISGQLRSWALAMPPLAAQLRSQGEVDIFVSTWSQTATFSRRFAHKQFSPLVQSVILDLPDPFDASLSRLLPGLVHAPDDLGRTLVEALSTEHILIEDEADFERRLPKLLPSHEPSTVNQLKMYYKMHSAWRMQERHSRSTAAEYDFVIRVRPDFLIKCVPFAEIYDRVDNTSVVAGSYAYFDSFDDRFAIGSPAAMARHASTWRRMREAGTHRCLPLVNDVLAEELMMANLVATGCQPIVLRDIEVVSQNALHVSASDEDLISILEACAARQPLRRRQAKLAGMLARSEDDVLAQRARRLVQEGWAARGAS